MRERLSPRLRRLVRPRLLGVARARLGPVSDRWGEDRGTPIDRYYIERFLAEHRTDIRGVALEVKDDGYVRRLGSDLERVEVLDIDAANRRATIVADLGAPDAIPGGLFDCFVLTQTLQYIVDPKTAVANAYRLLAPSGVLLVTVPSITRVTDELPGLVDYWRFTEASCRLLFGDVFGHEHVTVVSHGNVSSAAGFLAGYAAEELSAPERDAVDARFPVVVCVRAQRL